MQWQLRALQLRSDGDWPTLEYGMQMEWFLEVSEVLTELLEQRSESPAGEIRLPHYLAVAVAPVSRNLYSTVPSG